MKNYVLASQHLDDIGRILEKKKMRNKAKYFINYMVCFGNLWFCLNSYWQKLIFTMSHILDYQTVNVLGAGKVTRHIYLLTIQGFS